MGWLKNIETLITNLFAKCEAVAQEIGAELPVIEQGALDAGAEIASVFEQVAPLLLQLDALISPTLHNIKATSANASAVAVLTKIQSVAQSVTAMVNAETVQAPDMSGGQ